MVLAEQVAREDNFLVVEFEKRGHEFLERRELIELRA